MSGMRINTNTPALFAQRIVGLNKAAINRSIERLASGLGINRAADDAAGLAITERMRSQIEGLNQGTRNIQDGISLIQTAEGGLQAILDTLQRMRTLAVQASNDTLTDSDRSLIQLEIDQHIDEIDRQASTVSFNTKRLLDGSAQVGTVSTVSTIVSTTPVTESFVVAENLFDITTTVFASESAAKVSPDGTQVVYSNFTGPGSQLETRPIGGGAATVIATGFVDNFAPEISPDGTMIAFSGFNGVRTDIYTIPIGGGAITNVTNGLGVGNGSPTWAPELICEPPTPTDQGQRY